MSSFNATLGSNGPGEGRGSSRLQLKIHSADMDAGGNPENSHVNTPRHRHVGSVSSLRYTVQ